MRRPPATRRTERAKLATRSVVSAAASRSRRRHAAERSRRCASTASTPRTASRERARRTRACTRRPCRSTGNRRRGRDVRRAKHGKRPHRDRCSARVIAREPIASLLRPASRAPTTASRRPSRSSRPAVARARRRACARPASARCVADRAGSWYKAGSRPRMLRGGRVRRKAARTAARHARPDPPPDARSR